MTRWLFILTPHHQIVPVLGKSKEEAKQIAEKFLTYVNMWDRKDSYPGMLSGGQKQRVAIAVSYTHLDVYKRQGFDANDSK